MNDPLTGRLRIGVLFSRVRVEEKWIFAALEQRGVDYERLDDRLVHFDLDHPASGSNTTPSSSAASATCAACMPCRS